MSLFNISQAVKTATAAKYKKPVKGKAAPEKADIRVYRDGTVMVNPAFAEKFSLEFAPAGSPILTKGANVFKSSDWSVYPIEADDAILIAFSGKTQKKHTLWGGAAQYGDDQQLKNSVYKSRVTKGGKEVLQMLIEFFNLTVDDSDKLVDTHVDLLVSADFIDFKPGEVAHIPFPNTTKTKDEQPLIAISRENCVIHSLQLYTEEAYNAIQAEGTVGEVREVLAPGNGAAENAPAEVAL